MSAYARPAMHSTQDGPGGTPASGDEAAGGERSAVPTVASEPETGVPHAPVESVAERSAAIERADEVGHRASAALLRWGFLLTAGSLVTLVARMPEHLPFVVLPAMFALAQSWDFRERTRLYLGHVDHILEPGELGQAVRFLFPAFLAMTGLFAYGTMAWWVQREPSSQAHLLASYWCVAAAVLCLGLVFPPISQWFASRFVRPPAHTYTARLTATIAVIVLLLPVPMRLVIDDMMDTIVNADRALITMPGLIGQLAGELALAFAGVGLWVSRTPRAAWARLGLGRMGVREWIVAAVGVAVLFGLNFSLDWLQRAWFPDLWRQDRAMIEVMVRDLTLPTVLVLGVSAGVGEELVLRGALQPRVGLVWASVIFAAAHVQYTWFGMVVVALFGIALGLVRQRTNTTTAIVVHGLYDILVAFAPSP